jgi:hypothetical protein
MKISSLRTENESPTSWRTARRFTKFRQLPLEIHVVGDVARATLKPEANHPNGSCLSRNLPNLDGVMQSRDGAGRHGMSLYQPLTTQGRNQKTRYGNDWMRISAGGVL